MSEPVVAQKAPFPVEVEAGKTYYWCACGKSAKQPFCDGSHKGSEFAPIAYKAEQDGKVWFCGCKHSAKKPLRRRPQEALSRRTVAERGADRALRSEADQLSVQTVRRERRQQICGIDRSAIIGDHHQMIPARLVAGRHDAVMSTKLLFEAAHGRFAYVFVQMDDDVYECSRHLTLLLSQAHQVLTMTA